MDVNLAGSAHVLDLGYTLAIKSVCARDLQTMTQQA